MLQQIFNILKMNLNRSKLWYIFTKNIIKKICQQTYTSFVSSNFSILTFQSRLLIIKSNAATITYLCATIKLRKKKELFLNKIILIYVEICQDNDRNMDKNDERPYIRRYNTVLSNNLPNIWKKLIYLRTQHIIMI